MKKHRVFFFRCLASCCRLDKGMPLSASWLRREPLLKRDAFCVHIVRPSPVSVDVRLKAEHDKKKNKAEHDKL